MRCALAIERLTGGGAEAIVVALAEALAVRGCQVFIYCLDTPGRACAGLHPRIRVRSFHSRGRDPLLLVRLVRALRADRVEVVNAHSSAAAFWLAPAARLLDIPLVHTRQGDLFDERRRNPYRARLAWVSSWIRATVLVAESLRPSLPPRLARDAITIANAVDRPPPQPAAARDALTAALGRAARRPLVLSVGTLCHEKDQLGLLAAFTRIAARHPAAHLVLVGPERDAGYAAALDRAARRAGLADRVHQLGAVPDAWRLMATADVFCLSSRTEASPVAVVEAMSQAAPIVATAVGGIGTVAPARTGSAALLRNGETAWIVPPGRPDDLAQALDAALAAPEEARRRAKAARRDYLARLTADGMAARYAELFERVVGARPLRTAAPLPAGVPRRTRIVMVAPGVPALGGMASVADALTAAAGDGEVRRVAAAAPATALWPQGWFARVAHAAGRVRAHLAAARDLARTIRVRRPALVHIHTCSGVTFLRGLLDAAVARLLGRAVVMHIHGGRFAAFVNRGGGPARLAGRLAPRLVHRFVVLSERSRQALAACWPAGRIDVIANGVPLDAAASCERRRTGAACRFLFLGELRAAKGVGDLITAAARLAARGVPFELILAGPCSAAERAAWQRVVASAGLCAVVRVLPPVRGAAKRALLTNADCLVLPSWSEAMPMVLLEAGAAGLPVVATAVGDVPEMLAGVADADEPGPLVPPRAPDALAEVLARVAGDARLRERWAKRWRGNVRAQYGVRRQLERLRALYRAVLAERRRAAARRRSPHEWLARKLLLPLHEWLRGRTSGAIARELHGLTALPPETLAARCRSRFEGLAEFARARLGHYRSLDGPPDAWPVLDKAAVRRHAARLVHRPERGIPYSSGGTSGDTLRFLIDRRRQSEDLGARQFMQSLFGLRPGDRRAYVWGSPIETAAGRVKRLRDRLIGERMFNAFAMSDDDVREMVAELRRWQPRGIYGYPSAIARLAAAIEAGGRGAAGPFPALQLVVLTGEEVRPDEAAAIGRAFRAPVVSEYGNRETGLIAHGCPRGRLHVLSPHVRVEVLRGGTPVTPGEAGDIVVTTLGARVQPFIRYRVGDVGRLVPEPCTCGLALPVMELLGGKVTGFVALPDGRLCHGAITSHMLRGLPAIAHYRTIQHAVDAFEVQLVVEPGADRTALVRAIERRYAARIGGGTRVVVRFYDALPPDPSGKRRYVISHVAEQQARAGACFA